MSLSGSFTSSQTLQWLLVDRGELWVCRVLPGWWGRRSGTYGGSLFKDVRRTDVHVLVPSFLSAALVIPSGQRVPNFVGPLMIVSGQITRSRASDSSLVFMRGKRRVRIFPAKRGGGQSRVVFRPSSVVPCFLFRRVPGPVLLRPDRCGHVKRARRWGEFSGFVSRRGELPIFRGERTTETGGGRRV